MTNQLKTQDSKPETSTRIQQLFNNPEKKNLSIYFTAGYPNLNDTITILNELQNSGVDLVEIGMPFSDPLADGPTIQKSSEIALKNGITLKLLFEQLKDIRNFIDIPLVLMGYLNPVLQFGIQNFCEQAHKIGIDGILLPDLPMQEYVEQYRPAFEQNELANIFLITPQTSDERVRKVDELSNGFIYMVSSASTTGSQLPLDLALDDYARRIHDMHLKNPVMAGFGISNKASFEKATAYTNGAIIGSAFIKAIEKSDNLSADIKRFISSVRS